MAQFLNVTSIGTGVYARFIGFNDTVRKLDGFSTGKIVTPDEVNIAKLEKGADNTTIVYALPIEAPITLFFTHGSSGAQLMDQVAQSSITNLTVYQAEITVTTLSKKYTYTRGVMTGFKLSGAEEKMTDGEYKLTFGEISITDL